MKILQVAPIWEVVPPPRYGGIELVCSLLTDELVRRGHDVVLAATGNSTSDARLISVFQESMRAMIARGEVEPHFWSTMEMIHLELVRQEIKANKPDIVHSHIWTQGLTLRDLGVPVLHTMHNGLNSITTEAFKAVGGNFVSISDSYAAENSALSYYRTVYNGLAIDRFDFVAQPKGRPLTDDSPTCEPYLAFLGRLSPDKGPDEAIRVALQTGMNLILAGKLDDIQVDYYRNELEPFIDGKQIRFIGEVNHQQKNELLGNAAGFLFPIAWQEPFGLVMVESLATGTPVIAMARGSVPEIVTEKTGFVCQTFQELCDGVTKIGTIDRADCRRQAERFGVSAMADGYLEVYQELIAAF